MTVATLTFYSMLVNPSIHDTVKGLHFAIHVSGIGLEEAERLIESAQMACKEDVYHFDEIEQFFLVSCLGLW